MNQASTTLTALRKQTKDEAYKKLYGLVEHNITALRNQLEWIATQPAQMRLFRITSDFLPAYTAEEFTWAYDTDMKAMVERDLAWVRPFAEQHGIRLCTHPGQFTTLCTQKPTVLENSIEDLHYHGFVAESMGFGDTWHSNGFAINIHANNNLDPGLEQIKSTIANKLSPTLRNLITIENDEFGCSVDEMISAKLYESAALVLDIHHHWVESGASTFRPTTPA